MESEQAHTVDSIKDVVWSSVKVPRIEKHLVYITDIWKVSYNWSILFIPK